jgi:hypothetical protein
MYANDIFYFLKIIFNINTSKRFKKYKIYLILIKNKKKLNYLKTLCKKGNNIAQRFHFCMDICFF